MVPAHPFELLVPSGFEREGVLAVPVFAEIALPKDVFVALAIDPIYLHLPEVPANCAWGDDGKTLYMTAVTSVYRVRTLVGW